MRPAGQDSGVDLFGGGVELPPDDEIPIADQLEPVAAALSGIPDAIELSPSHALRSGADEVAVGDLFAGGAIAAPAAPGDEEMADVGQLSDGAYTAADLLGDSDLLVEAQVLPAEPSPTPPGDDEPTVEPPPDAMPTSVMPAQSASSAPGLVVLAAEPVGDRTPSPRSSTVPGSAASPPVAPEATPQAEPPRSITASYATASRSVTPDDPTRDPDAGSVEERLARTESLCRELAAEVRDLVNLLVEQGTFTREDFKEWRSKKW